MRADVKDKGLTFLFIHGFSGSARRWDFQVEYFRALGRVITVDLPGHGNAPWRNETLGQMADGVMAVLDREGVDRGVVVVASSFGGLVTLDLWQKRPELFRQIFFVGSVPRFTWTEDFPAGLNEAKIRSLKGQMARDLNVAMDAFFRALFMPVERASAQYALIKELRKGASLPSIEVLNAYLDILGEQDSRAVLRKVTVPVDFIFGDADHICPPAVIEPLRMLCPQARITVMPGCGHLPFLSGPDAFNALLKDHLV
jgi:pimeloyl-[acyl-carrier protein] methyl ester esterase